MKITSKEKPLIVFVSKDFKTAGIYQDMVIKVAEDKFKSIKFRHTYYNQGDFNFTLEEAEQYVVNSHYAQAL